MTHAWRSAYLALGKEVKALDDSPYPDDLILLDYMTAPAASGMLCFVI
jgi:hypothetical protein